MTREEFTVVAIENGWTIVVIANTISIFSYHRYGIMLTSAWHNGRMIAVKRERGGQITHYNQLRDIEESAIEWLTDILPNYQESRP